MGKKFLIILCVTTLCLSGCGSRQEAGYAMQTTGQEDTAPNADMASAGLAIPVPAACVDRMGYQPQGEKIVIFQGGDLPDTFALVDAETDSVVYTGSIQKKGNDEEDTEYNGYGDFSAYGKAGQYYIRTDTYGESYPFLIHDNLYDSLFQYTCKELYQRKDTKEREMSPSAEPVTDSALVLYRLLLSYEMFPEVHAEAGEPAESANEIPDLLDLCKAEAEFLMMQEPASGDSGIYQAAALAKYAYLTRSLDQEFAGACLKAAESAWKDACKDLFVSDDLVSMAASELYRLTGSRQYLGLAEEYLRAATETTEDLSDAEFYAAITYMNTRSTVDMELCDALIRKIMEEAEYIAEQSRQSAFLVCGESSDTDTLLQQAGRLCVVNHIITNHEYGTVIDNHLHYLLGRNAESICHIAWWEQPAGPGDEAGQDGAQMAAVFFLLSERKSHEG